MKTKEEIAKQVYPDVEGYLDQVEHDRIQFIRGLEYSDQNTKPLMDKITLLEAKLKAAESVNEKQTKLNESILKYSENQRKIIVLLLEGIEEVKGHLPFATNLKLTEIVNTSQSFTKPLPTNPI